METNRSSVAPAADLLLLAPDSRYFSLLALVAMYSMRALRSGLQRSTVSGLLCLISAVLLLEAQAVAVVCCSLLLLHTVSVVNCLNFLHDLLWTDNVSRRLPLNSLSRLWGHCHQLPLPPFLRAPAYRLYSRVCSCNLEEADFSDLRQYRNLSEFFRRDLKPHVRPVCPRSCLVSPADGTILHFGRVSSGHLEQVKGITYTLQGFLGPRPLAGRREFGASAAAPRDLNRSSTSPDLAAPMDSRVADSVYHEQLKHNPQHELYHCVIYLSPGDYHKFHSAASWTVAKRRHFPGFLLSVSPRVANIVRGLFCLNERVVYMGRWRHGFFSYTAVGATNVGSIRVFKDEELRTNQHSAGSNYSDQHFAQLPVDKGELFGEFNLGSTIVLLFEAPAGFEFSLEAGQKIRVGESLGRH